MSFKSWSAAQRTAGHIKPDDAPKAAATPDLPTPQTAKAPAKGTTTGKL